MTDELGIIAYTYDANGNILTVNETDKEKLTLALGIEVFFVLLYGYSTVKFAGFSLKLPKIFKEMDPNKLLDLVKNNKLHEMIFEPK